MRTILLCMVTAILVLMSNTSAIAVNPAISIDHDSGNWGVEIYPDYQDFTIGYDFDTNMNITVSELGFFDLGEDGLNQNHTVGIFNAEGSLLISATVESTDPLDNYFRYKSVTPYQLNAGATYYIAASSNMINPDTFIWNIPVFNVDPAITFRQDRIALSEWAFPDMGTSATTGYIGPNMKISVVPEPISSTLFLVGAATLGFRRMKKRVS